MASPSDAKKPASLDVSLVLSDFDKFHAAFNDFISAGGSAVDASSMKTDIPPGDYLDTLLSTFAPGAQFVSVPLTGKLAGTAGATSSNPESPFIYINKDTPGNLDPTYVRGHEIGHYLAKKQLGDPTALNEQFDAFVGNKKNRLQVVKGLIANQKYLQENYGVGKDFYFDPGILKQIEEKGMYTGDILHEQLASLGAIEARYKNDITTDPKLKKEVFNTPEIRAAIRASIGSAATRLDAKDNPPFTLVPEKQRPPRDVPVLDIIKQLFF